jgi:hypothetical protein
LIMGVLIVVIATIALLALLEATASDRLYGHGAAPNGFWWGLLTLLGSCLALGLAWTITGIRGTCLPTSFLYRLTDVPGLLDRLSRNRR